MIQSIKSLCRWDDWRNRDLPHSIWSCLCCYEVGPFSIILNLLVIITALWMLSLKKGDSVETEKELNFIFRYTPNRTKTVLMGIKMIYNLNYFKRSINQKSDVTIWNVTPKGVWGNPEDGFKFPLGVKWSLKLMLLFSCKTAKRPLLTSGIHFSKGK